MRPGIVLLPSKDVTLMAVFVFCLYYPNICLHVNGTFTIMQVTHTVYNDAPQYRPGQMFAFAPVTGESLVGPKNVLQKQAHI